MLDCVALGPRLREDGADGRDRKESSDVLGDVASELLVCLGVLG
jgi:hypothetical protein